MRRPNERNHKYKNFSYLCSRLALFEYNQYKIKPKNYV